MAVPSTAEASAPDAAPADVARFLSDAPSVTGSYEGDAAAYSPFWQEGNALLARLPPKAQRGQAEQAVADTLIGACRTARQQFLRTHAEALYGKLTTGLTRFARVEEVAYSASAAVPGLVPTQETVAAEARQLQRVKEGHEYDQGLLFNAFLGNRRCGLHLCHAMLLPRQEAIDHRDRLERDGRIEFDTAIIERRGNVSTVFMKNPRFLNAEDDTTVHNVETAVDLALLDPATAIAVLRGARIIGGKYDGQGVFSTGINLTRLYRGEIPYLWYLIRDMGFINKMYRGLAMPSIAPDEVHGETIEKPWVAAVEKFAIGGGCQYLLATDYVVAASDAYMTLPARKEGIIPGVANLRLPRFVGDRVARQLVMYDRRLDCASPEGRLICDEIAEAGQLETTLDRVTSNLANSGVVSAAGNRRAFRIAQEPLDLFRSYMAVYAREQAACHFSPALIRNLEQFWGADRRVA